MDSETQTCQTWTPYRLVDVDTPNIIQSLSSKSQSSFDTYEDVSKTAIFCKWSCGIFSNNNAKNTKKSTQKCFETESVNTKIGATCVVKNILVNLTKISLGFLINYLLFQVCINQPGVDFLIWACKVYISAFRLLKWDH